MDACIHQAHYSDVIMGAIASQMTNLTIVFSTIYSDADQRKHQSSASLAIVRGIHSPHKGPVTRKLFPFDDVIVHISFLTIYNTTFYGLGLISQTIFHRNSNLIEIQFCCYSSLPIDRYNILHMPRQHSCVTWKKNVAKSGWTENKPSIYCELQWERSS